jgi:hypothetical protein
MTTPSKTNAPAAARIEQVRQDLARELSRTNRANALTIVIGVIALVGLAIYFYVGYSKIKPMTEPDKLVYFVEQQIQDKIPEARSKLEDEIKRNAPKWAQGLSDQARQNLPTAREKLEQHILEQLESKMNEVAQLSDQEFRTFLRKNKPTLQKNFQDLSQRETLADQALDQLVKAMETEFQADMKKESAQLLATLVDINTHFKKLKAGGKDLTPAEQNERRVLMLLRREAAENIDPLLGKTAPQEQPARTSTAPRQQPRPKVETPTKPKVSDKTAGTPPKTGEKKK